MTNIQPIKIFVSGKFADKPLIKTKMTELQELGYILTHDWTIHETNHNGVSNKTNAAINDINGIKACDIQIIIISDDKYPYRGTFTELGCSLGLEKQVLILCSFKKAYCMTNPFYYHPLVKHYESWSDLLVELELESKKLKN